MKKKLRHFGHNVRKGRQVVVDTVAASFNETNDRNVTVEKKTGNIHSGYESIPKLVSSNVFLQC